MKKIFAFLLPCFATANLQAQTTSFVNGVFIKKKIGFGLGSSKWLARSLVRYSGIRENKNSTILELWAWYGIVTREILKYKEYIASATIIEFEKERAESLEELTEWNIEIIHGDAREIDKFLEHGSIDIVISTLPLWSFDQETVEQILTQIQSVLKKWGTYIQYQYWMANKKDIKKYFLLEKIRFELRNFTPAWIYVTKRDSSPENIKHH